MIQVRIGQLADSTGEGVVRPISGHLEPVTAESRDLLAAAGGVVQLRLEQCGELPAGAAVVTPAGNLPFPFLIHVAVQSVAEPATAPLIQAAFLNGLRRAEALGLERVSTPPLGTGAGCLDAEGAAEAMNEAWGIHRRNSAPPMSLEVVVGSAYEEDVFLRLMAGERR